VLADFAVGLLDSMIALRIASDAQSSLALRPATNRAHCAEVGPHFWHAVASFGRSHFCRLRGPCSMSSGTFGEAIAGHLRKRP